MHLTIPGLKPQKHWAKVPDDIVTYHPYDDENGAVWCPVVGPDTVRCDIRLAKRAGTDSFEDYGRIGRYDSGMMGIANEYNPDLDWVLYCNDQVLMVGNDRNTLRDVFNHQHRWKFIRPPALKLPPDDDEVEEILANVVHINDAAPGNLALRYHLGPVLDVALIRSVNKKRTKIEIAGDTVTFGPDEFLPPTTHRKNEFREGIRKLRAPVATPRPQASNQLTYAEDSSDCVPGRPDLRINVFQGKRTERYLWFDFELANQGKESINWLHYQWSSDGEVPKGKGPFAFQNDRPFTVFSITTHGYLRTLYPGCSEKISVCVGKDVGPGEIKVFIPAYYFGGHHGCYFMLALIAP